MRLVGPGGYDDDDDTSVGEEVPNEAGRTDAAWVRSVASAGSPTDTAILAVSE
jgi:hypothetical protein